MRRKSILLTSLLILLVTAWICPAEVDPNAVIYWITEDLGGGNSDQGFVDLLTDAGYTVDMTFNQRQLRVLEDSELETLNRADLIIFSRDTDSRQYATNAEVVQWNQKIARPIINLNAFYMQANRWNWIPSSDTWHYEAGPMRVLEPNHPVMAGVTVTDGLVNVVTSQCTFSRGAEDAGGGTLIGVREDNGFVWLATWDTTQNLSIGYPPAGPRLLYCCGLDEATTGKQPVLPGSGTYNLTEEGAKVFLNSVEYMLGFTVEKSVIPEPEDGAVISTSALELGWAPADGTVSDNVYFGESREAVKNATTDSPEFKGNQEAISYMVDGLIPGNTYYWRIDGVLEDDPDNPIKGDVWSFFVAPVTAYNPTPADDARLIGLEPILTWEPGVGAEAHDVYFGTSADAVANATETSPEYRFQNLPDIMTWQPVADGQLTLENNTRYYWRIDEHSDGGVQKGQVWSFETTQPAFGTCTREVWTNIGVESREVDILRADPRYPDSPTETTELLLFDSSANLGDWGGARIKAWLHVPFDGMYTFKMSAYSPAELWLGTVPGDRTQLQHILTIPIERLPRNDWRFTSEPVELKAGQRYYIESVWVTTNFGDHCQVAWEGPGLQGIEVIQGSYLEPVEELWARSPLPVNKATLVPQNPLLSWIAGTRATQHLLYLGTDPNAVAAATPESEGIYQGSLTDPNFAPATLAWNTTYYWRVDEVNPSDAGSPWPGPVWSFTTAPYAVLEDFEVYTDIEGSDIWSRWIDGFEVDENGSLVGYWPPPVMEKTTVNSGLQSMPMFYANVDTASVSEAKLPLDPAQDWRSVDGHTIGGLSLWIHGAPESPSSIVYDTGTDTHTLHSAGGNIGGGSDQGFFAYQTLSGNGSITARIDEVEMSAENAKVGLMVRESLAADAAMVMINYQPRGRVQMLARSMAGEAAQATNSPIGDVAAPIWLRLTWTDGLFAGAYSVDGTTWVDILAEAFGPAQFFVTMPAEVLVGLAASPQLTEDLSVTAEAKISQVTIGDAASGSFDQTADLGLEYNQPDNLYVVVEDAAGKQVTVPHPDNPQAVVTAEWKQWVIGLDALAGIDLGSVAQLKIGVGTPDGSASEAEGKIYVDDIGLQE